MRLNQFIARATGMSRRQADSVISEGRVWLNGVPASLGQPFDETDTVTLDGKPLSKQAELITIMLHKPVSYVCSRNGQGSKTVYDLLPPELHNLKPVGRLDKDSSGLLLMTNDGTLANELTHPRYAKTKGYEIKINMPLRGNHLHQITKQGVQLNDGMSKFELQSIDKDQKYWQVTMQEGRNRQIRRTFATLGYNVIRLHRTSFGSYTLSTLPVGQYQSVQNALGKA